MKRAVGAAWTRRSEHIRAPQSMVALLHEEAPQIGAREEVRLLWRYDRWRATPVVARSLLSAGLRFLAGAAVGATLAQVAVGSEWVSNFVADIAGAAAAAGFVWWSRGWPWRAQMTNRLEALQRPNWRRGADVYVPREDYSKACAALHRAGVVTRGGLPVHEGIPDRPELNLRVSAYEPSFRETEADLFERMLKPLRAEGIPARVGNIDA